MSENDCESAMGIHFIAAREFSQVDGNMESVSNEG
jgi:hypothetical protein